MRQSVKNEIISSIESTNPLIYINHFDSYLFNNLIQDIAEDASIYEYTDALGVKYGISNPFNDIDLISFLKELPDIIFDLEKDLVVILNDIHNDLDKPEVIALLKYLSNIILYYDLDFSCTIFILSSKLVIPKEIEPYITIIDIPAPHNVDIINIMNEFIDKHYITISGYVFNEIALALKGLNEFQINKILNIAYMNGGTIDLDDKQLILKEKEQFLKKSGMLELVNFKDTIEDIGGLDVLKEWLEQKAKIFKNLDEALKFGVSPPNGIMIVGMPGCGKSLTAKATASLFNIPLVRLDVGRLLGKYVGESEDNMRQALRLAEDTSPCVLWIDEIEKAFSGIGGQGGSEVTTRLFGQFLTWMQEKSSNVFIVATANDISNIPPEFLRKGRFDELFFVDLPTKTERKNILEIHLKNKKKFNLNIDIDKLASKTDGFNGADLESTIKDAIETVFLNDKGELSTDDLLNAIKSTKSISATLKDKLASIKDTIKKMDIKSASK